MKRTCKITNGPNFIPSRVKRPDYNSYHPSRKRLLALGLRVGRKSTRRVAATS